MSTFLLPNSLIDAIEEIMNSFWWGHGGSNSKGIHWMEWDKLSVHKENGGRGFKDLTAFNLDMLGKQAWKLQSSPDSPVSRLFKEKYFPRTNFWHRHLVITQAMCGGVYQVQSSLSALVLVGVYWSRCKYLYS
jgi:hypothetical protein